MKFQKTNRCNKFALNPVSIEEYKKGCKAANNRNMTRDEVDKFEEDQAVRTKGIIGKRLFFSDAECY